MVAFWFVGLEVLAVPQSSTGTRRPVGAQADRCGLRVFREMSVDKIDQDLVVLLFFGVLAWLVVLI